MKFSRIAILISSVIIIHSVCAVWVLLDFTDNYSGSYSMYCSGFNHNNIALFNFNFIQNVCYCIIRNSAFNFFFISILFKSAVKIWARFTVNNIPHLILAILAFIFKCIFIIRMNLYWQCLLCINKLYKDRESVLCLTFPSKTFFSDNWKIITKKHTLVSTICYTAWSIRMCW